MNCSRTKQVFIVNIKTKGYLNMAYFERYFPRLQAMGNISTKKWRITLKLYKLLLIGDLLTNLCRDEDSLP